MTKILSINYCNKYIPLMIEATDKDIESFKIVEKRSTDGKNNFYSDVKNFIWK